MKRIFALDQFRGLTIIAMVLANYLAGARIVPAWLKHNPDAGLTVIDLIAPFFIFAIGVTYHSAFQRREMRDGRLAAYLHFVQRYLVLIGIGTILSAGEAALGFEHVANRWGVLEAIGVSGLVLLLVIRLPAPWLFLAGLALLGVYQIILDRFWLETVLNSSHGGLQGSLAWSAMLILAVGLADLYHHPRTRKWGFPLAGSGILAAGLALSLVTPISKNRVSGPYALVSLGAAVLLFTACHISATVLEKRLPLLEMWGRNPLALYLLHMLLLGLFALPPVPVWYSEAPAWLIVLQAAFLVVLLTLAARWMERRGVILKL